MLKGALPGGGCLAQKALRPTRLMVHFDTSRILETWKCVVGERVGPTDTSTIHEREIRCGASVICWPRLRTCCRLSSRIPKTNGKAGKEADRAFVRRWNGTGCASHGYRT